MYKNKFKNKNIRVTDKRIYCLLNELYGNTDSIDKDLINSSSNTGLLDKEAIREDWDEGEEDRR